MDNTSLVLTFNETVNASSLNVGGITIQSGSTSSLDYHSSPRLLTGGVNETLTMSGNNFLIIINLGLLDRNEIKHRQNLAVDNNPTYIALTNSAIKDINGNDVVAILD